MKTLFRIGLWALVALSLSVNAAESKSQSLEANKAIAVGFLDTMFNKHQPREAYEKYASPRFHHHAQWAGPGTPEGIVAHNIEASEKMLKNLPNTQREIKQVVAEGDLVVIHSHATGSMSDGEVITNMKKGSEKAPKTGDEVVDIFRIEGGKVAEHWEVSQPTTSLKDVY